jgi:hypothetical protein
MIPRGRREWRDFSVTKTLINQHRQCGFGARPPLHNSVFSTRIAAPSHTRWRNSIGFVFRFAFIFGLIAFGALAAAERAADGITKPANRATDRAANAAAGVG